jgi:2-polyprenyl-6-methoxyphenol hydroxylase-like FAD-dependent oxidoreductase
MAMEDGVMLAIALRDQPDIERAFAVYETARRERVERIVAHGARSSSAIPGTIGRAARDTFLRVAFRYLITDRGLDWLYGHRIDWDGPLRTARRALAPV